MFSIENLMKWIFPRKLISLKYIYNFCFKNELFVISHFSPSRTPAQLLIFICYNFYIIKMLLYFLFRNRYMVHNNVFLFLMCEKFKKIKSNISLVDSSLSVKILKYIVSKMSLYFLNRNRQKMLIHMKYSFQILFTPFQ